MHTYRKSKDDLWTVGYFNPQNAARWEALRDFESEKAAAAYAHYLNGGSGQYPVRLMTQAQFINGLRILFSLDAHELGDPEWWPDFANSFSYLMRCDDERAEIIWQAMIKRGALARE